MTLHSYPGRLALLTLPLALLVAVAVPAQAEQETSSQLALPHATMWNGPALAGAEMGAGEGMRVAIDPATGELRRPSAAQVRALEEQQPQQVRRAFAASQVERPDGTVMMALGEELLNFSVVRLDGGSAAFSCVEGAAHADLQFLSTAAPAAEEK